MHFRLRNLGIATGIVITIVLLMTLALVWVSSAHDQLQKPVMDGQPINYWLERMGAGDDRNQIRDRLVSIGPPVAAPLLAALNDSPSPPSLLKLKVSSLLAGRFPAVEHWLWQRRPSSRWMAAYTRMARS
jgi:hypothetical protein